MKSVLNLSVAAMLMLLTDSWASAEIAMHSDPMPYGKTLTIAGKYIEPWAGLSFRVSKGMPYEYYVSLIRKLWIFLRSSPDPSNRVMILYSPKLRAAMSSDSCKMGIRGKEMTVIGRKAEFLWRMPGIPSKQVEHAIYAESIRYADPKIQAMCFKRH